MTESVGTNELLKDNFALSVVTWQEKFGRHHLPWQHSGAYATWISEIMLQQTQVGTVINYFKKFMTQFPNIAALANANIDEVLAIWSGLGYYARARNIHKSAQMIVNDFDGKLPSNIEDLIKLPGIGPSTAGAIMALGHKLHGVILDGNVKRILSRCFGRHLDGQSHHAQKELWQLSHWVTPEKNCHIYTQGVMDLGASVCHKSHPQCNQCPLQNLCYAYKHGITAHLPYPKIIKTKPSFTKHLVIPFHQEKIGLIKRPDTGIWGGLWTPLITDELPKTIEVLRTYHTIKHIFTHQTWIIKPLLANDPLDQIEHWFSPEDALQLGIPKPVRDIIEIIHHDQINTLQEIE